MQKLSLTVSTNLVRVQGITNNLERCRFKKLSSLENLSYQKTRRPTSTGIFCTHLFCWRCLIKDEGGFFQKNTLSSLSYVIFPNLKNFCFLAKTSQLRWKRHFQIIISFDTHSTANLLLLLIFLKNLVFFQKKEPSFFEKTFVSIWEILVFQSCSTANLL